MWRFGLVLVGLMVLSSQALGQTNVWKVGTCKPQSVVESYLKGQYKEEVIAGGVTNGGGLAELWVGETTWTMILRRPGEIMCLMGAGEGWRDYPQEVKGLKS